MKEKKEVTTKKLISLTLALILALTGFQRCLCGSGRFPRKTHRRHRLAGGYESEVFFQFFTGTLEAAGSTWVQLEQVKSADLPFDAQGKLTMGVTEIGMLTSPKNGTALKWKSTTTLSGTCPIGVQTAAR